MLRCNQKAIFCVCEIPRSLIDCPNEISNGKVGKSTRVERSLYKETDMFIFEIEISCGLKLDVEKKNRALELNISDSKHTMKKA